TGGVENISGSGTAALYPGASVRLVLSIRNTKSTAVTVNDLSVTAGNASARCAADNLALEHPTGTLQLPGSATTKLAVVMRMLSSAPDACKNVAFPLSFSGVATGADDAAVPPAVTDPASPTDTTPAGG